MKIKKFLISLFAAIVLTFGSLGVMPQQASADYKVHYSCGVYACTCYGFHLGWYYNYYYGKWTYGWHCYYYGPYDGSQQYA